MEKGGIIQFYYGERACVCPAISVCNVYSVQGHTVQCLRCHSLVSPIGMNILLNLQIAVHVCLANS